MLAAQLSDAVLPASLDPASLARPFTLHELYRPDTKQSRPTTIHFQDGCSQIMGYVHSSINAAHKQLTGVTEVENAIKLTDPHRDALYAYSPEAQKKVNEARAWRTDPQHFKYVRISAVALIKMVMHARSGGNLEIMGLMLGYVQHETFIVTDALRLPVEGTETRVNAQSEADEYMVKFLEQSREAGQLENAVGWYHSHPGYGCWLSGIDVGTQATQQMWQDPFLAVVIDPDRTISAGKVEIGAFRTYPEGYKPVGQESAAEGMAEVKIAIRGARVEDIKVFDKYKKAFVIIRNQPFENVEIVSVKAWRRPLTFYVPDQKKPMRFENFDDSLSTDVDMVIRSNAQFTTDDPPSVVLGGNKVKSGIPVELETTEYKFTGSIISI
ncbi:MAG: DUF4330 family protein, partial [Cytophagaceae bacterium]